MARFFIDRPIFAWVLAIATMLMGVLAIRSLPVAQYPSIAPPSISISVVYPGASAETVQSTVVQIIEQQLSGIDNLLYFTSETGKDGSASITLSFAQGTDPDVAQVQVQNKVALATPRLPQAVQQQGLRIAKATRNFLLVAGFVSTDGRLSNIDIGDYIASTVQDPLSRTPGVGDYQLFGAQYAMRVWVDPVKLMNFNLTPGDVSAAIQAQNVQVASGELGALPSVQGQQLNATIIGPTYLQTPEQFGAILLKVQPDGSRVLLRDVARVELGGENYAISSLYNGNPAAGIAIKLASGANALATEQAVRATIERLRPTFPAGVDVVFPYDTTPFVRLSIEEVVKTLIEAVILVFLVMFLFLQNFRATLIPTIAVPVVLLGTFAVLLALGYSINTLTLFGMVLAIGLLVDDAIVVVENVERLMEEEDLSPLEATRKSMEQITGALVGIALVLSAVFLPMAFFGGSTGVIYRQFSITIATAMGLSVLTAVIFTPALCATILKKPTKASHEKRGFFGWFNRNFDRGAHGYQRGVGYGLKRPKRVLLIYALIVAGMAVIFLRLPTSFVPDEDQGTLFIQVSAPPGATVERTQRAVDEVTRYLLEDEKDVVSSVFGITGFSFGGPRPEFRHGLRQPQAMGRSSRGSGQRAGFGGTRDAPLRRIPGCDDLRLRARRPSPSSGNATGFEFPAAGSRAGSATRGCSRRRNQLLGLAAQSPVLVGGAAKRAGRRAAIPPRHRLGARERARPVDRQHQHDGRLGLGLQLCQRLHRSRPGEARLHPGRGLLAHAAQRSRELVRAQCVRADGALLRLLHARNGPSARRSWSASTASAPSRSRAMRRRAPAPARPWPRWSVWRRNCRREPASTGAVSPTRSAPRVRRPRRSTRCRCSLSSSAWPRSMRAGPFRRR